MRSLLDALQTLSPFNFRRLWREFHSLANQASFCIAFGRDFGGFWKPKWMRKLMPGPVFFDVVLECVFALIFVRIFEAPKLKNRALASTRARFLQNRRFRKRYKKNMILDSFLKAKTQKIRLKINSNMCCFKASHFKHFFFDFASILDAKNRCKITKLRKN